MSDWTEIGSLLEREGFFIAEDQLDPMELMRAMRTFLDETEHVRSQFKQSSFGAGFDGYSFPGQSDSINQAYDDALHSMVLSDYFPVERYPKAFQPFLNREYPRIKNLIMHILMAKGVPDLDNYTCSVSVNYYPPIQKITSNPDSIFRLTEHVDGSLFTCFPFGNDRDLELRKNGSWKDWPKNESMTLFPGYLTELVSGGEIKALNHRLKWSANPDQERFSFAFFVVPRRESIIKCQWKGKWVELTSEKYYRKYLDLFD